MTKDPQAKDASDTPNKASLDLLINDQTISDVLEQTNDFFQLHPDISDELNQIVWLFRSLSDLLPGTIEKFWSGHNFPLAEAEIDLGCSLQFCRRGFYKHAFIALRNVLELGLLSVYWDVNDNSHIEIKNWLESSEPTPFKSTVQNKLRCHPYISIIDEKMSFFDEINKLYESLCNYTHSRGFLFSAFRLNNSNVNMFNENSLRDFIDSFKLVVRFIAILHILKYPVAFQFTPIEQKFGINGPAGGFLKPYQADLLRKFLEPKTVKLLQEISDNDPDAISLASWVNERPDISMEQFESQLEEFDKRMIECQGFENWLRNERKIMKAISENAPEELDERTKYCEKMRQWANENGFMVSKYEREN